ncbi:cytochrome bd-type quinol oxidase subunit 2 [Actinoplanes tereljensis]|uniref:Uncharacterized protein n=1 Tax=Paractinoplanes tereljensis TaxID=571912 RepID=A0A919TW11_9ACTN|nr:hypothetical protein [Actinoplanes tereljensis]GIF22462.1 hypothetical protein Ate02nite_51920 [Actinoplanes tereljensis]
MPFETSPAYDRVLADDRNYHIVFLVVGGLFTLLLVVFMVFSRLQFKRAGSRFERRTYLSFGAAGLTLVLFMALALWANVTSVVNPRKTLAGTTFSPVGEAWLSDGRAQISPLLQQAIDDRLAWQRPKAVICAILLVACVTLTVFLWRRLLRRSTAGKLAVTGGVLSAAACVLLMFMVIGNAEGALAPLTLTVIYG